MREMFRKAFDVLFEESFENEFEYEREMFAKVAEFSYEQTKHLGKAMTSALKSICEDFDFYNDVYVEKFGECPEIAPKF